MVPRGYGIDMDIESRWWFWLFVIAVLSLFPALVAVIIYYLKRWFNKN